MARPFFPIFFRNRDMLQYMGMEQRGELFTQLFAYADEGVLPENNDSILGMAFNIFRKDIDESLNKYKETCEKNRRNIAKRWNKTLADENTSEYDGIRSDTKNTKRREAETEEKKKGREVEAETEAEEKGEAACLPAVDAAEQQFRSSFGRNPSENFLRTVEQSNLTAEQISMAIQQTAKKHSICNPEGYITQILRTWAANGVPAQYQPKADQYNPPPDEPLADWEVDWLMQMQSREETSC